MAKIGDVLTVRLRRGGRSATVRVPSGHMTIVSKGFDKTTGRAQTIVRHVKLKSPSARWVVKPTRSKSKRRAR